MTFRLFHPRYSPLLFLVFAGFLSLAAKGAPEELIPEKQMKLGMRMIGHEVLKCLGDEDSRILPIEKTEQPQQKESYRITFESALSFDPDDIVSTIERVMKEHSIAANYLVEIEHFKTQAVVHSFAVSSNPSSGMIPCRGRILPLDRYSLVITILDGTTPLLENQQTAVNLTAAPAPSALAPVETQKLNLSRSAYFLIPLLFLMGFFAFFLSQKKSVAPDSPAPHGNGAAVDADPNLVLIGASQFDKRNMALSFADQSVELSHKEAELLSLLHSSANLPLEREIILQRVWGDEGAYVGRTLDVFISKLRKKLAADPSVKIVNIRGVGYKLVMDGPK